MTERVNQPIIGNSRTDRRAAERFQLDYATWRDHLAAPGSRFAPEGAAPSRTVRIDTASRRVDAAAVETERRAA